MLDSWMCHGDQELSEDLIKKGKGIRPREGEGLVAAAYIVFEIGCTQGWKGRNGDEVRVRFPTPFLSTSLVGPIKKADLPLSILASELRLVRRYFWYFREPTIFESVWITEGGRLIQGSYIHTSSP